VSGCPVERQLISIPAARGYTNYASVDVSHDISTGRARHSLLAGIEFFQTEAYSHWEVTSDSSLTTDLFDPRYVPIPLSLLQNPDQETYRNARERWGAAYVQDQVALGDEFYLLVGLRFDSAWAIIGETTRIPATQGKWTAYDAPSQAVQAIKHREGLVWHPTASLSFYVKYTQNFAATPSLYINVNGNSGLDLPQQSATEWETGVKLELPDGRATATLAAFDLTKENISSSLLEPALDPSGIQFFTGTARNVGLEADIHGELLPGLQVLANYAYIQSRIIYDSGNSVTLGTSGSELIGSTGDRLFGVPRNGGSAWGSYRFDDGMLRGLKSGAGMVARGARAGDNVNDYELPGFIKWNAFAAYDWLVRGTQMSIQLNVDNIFNARYFESVSGTRTVMPASPRRWLGSFRMQF
jgi:iron complex outermembrane receptor protein